MLKKILYFTLPFFVFLGCSILSGPLLRGINDPLIRALASLGLGIIIFIGLVILIRGLAEFAEVPIPSFGGGRFVWLGMLVGLLLSISSGFLFSATHGQSLNWSSFWPALPTSAISQISHAMTEEAVFRFGIVAGAASLGGTLTGILAGSLPFGVLHLLNRFFGAPVDAQQVVGIIVAGVLLSLLYLRYGLWATIGCHYVWNCLSILWVDGMQMERSSGITAFEGAWSTSALTAICCLIVIYISKGRKRQTQLRRAIKSPGSVPHGLSSQV